jgi:hypothetical protein
LGMPMASPSFPAQSATSFPLTDSSTSANHSSFPDISCSPSAPLPPARTRHVQSSCQAPHSPWRRCNVFLLFPRSPFLLPLSSFLFPRQKPASTNTPSPHHFQTLLAPRWAIFSFEHALSLSFPNPNPDSSLSAPGIAVWAPNRHCSTLVHFRCSRTERGGMVMRFYHFHHWAHTDSSKYLFHKSTSVP